MYLRGGRDVAVPDDRDVQQINRERDVVPVRVAGVPFFSCSRV